MKTLIAHTAIILSIIFSFTTMAVEPAYAQSAPKAKTAVSAAAQKADSSAAAADTAATQTADTAADAPGDAMDGTSADDIMPEEAPNFHKTLKTKFIEGNATFMSLVAIALVIGLAFCIERIIYLSLSEIDTDKFMADLDSLLAQGDVEGAKTLCRNTRGPVASICYQGLVRVAQPIDDIERSVASYGTVQAANLEKGCSWITLFIAMAPSLGFLGTVIGMVMAFEQIQAVGDINPTIVAAGMKVALITTIFGIIVALVLQIFYNYILTKIDKLTLQMEDSAITLLDSLMKLKASH